MNLEKLVEICIGPSQKEGSVPKWLRLTLALFHLWLVGFQSLGVVIYSWDSHFLVLSLSLYVCTYSWVRVHACAHQTLLQVPTEGTLINSQPLHHPRFTATGLEIQGSGSQSSKAGRQDGNLISSNHWTLLWTSVHLSPACFWLPLGKRRLNILTCGSKTQAPQSALLNPLLGKVTLGKVPPISHLSDSNDFKKVPCV